MTERQFEEFWDHRCPAWHPGCAICRAWQMRDLLAAVVREHDSPQRTAGSMALLVGEVREFLTSDEPRQWVDERSSPWGTPEEEW